MNHPRTCSKCGEFNPTQALLCWACHAPLTEEARRFLERNTQQQQRQQRREERQRDFVGRVLMVLWLGGTAVFIASGYFERNRKELLSAGTFAALLMGVWMKCQSIHDKRRREQESQLVYEAPAVQYANQILLYSLRQNAREIRFHTAYRGVSVEYLVDDELKSGTALPLELWPELRAHFARISGDWQNVISMSMQGRPFFFAARFERDSLQETLILTRHEGDN